MRHLALLRGINLNGHRTIRMEHLREMVSSLGHDDVRTFIQSGNVLFSTASEATCPELARALRDGIAARFGIHDVAVVVLTARELAEIVRANPFVKEGVQPRELYVTVLAHPPAADVVDSDLAGRGLPDRFEVVGRCVYVHCVHGYHRTKWTNAFFERRCGTSATTRNWNTMCRLADLALD